MKLQKRMVLFFQKWFVIFFAIVAITSLELVAFIKFPNRNMFDLLWDAIAGIIGFACGIVLNSVTKWISYTYKLNIAFGFLFLGLGWIASVLLKDHVGFLNYRETYIGTTIVIVSIIALVFLKKPQRIKDSDNTRRILNKIHNMEECKPQSGKLIITEAPTVFFHNRMCDAFPGMQDVIWITNQKVAVERLLILLREPTHFDDCNGYGTRPSPVWWLRGSRNLYIHKFKKLRHNRCLMNIDELRIKKIAIIKSVVYWQDCVYVETSPDKPTGLYKHSKKEIEQSVNEFGFCWEEYGIFGKRLINRTEYDDNAIIIKGKSIRTHGAELRARYISKYNFIISSATAPYNSHSIDRKLKQCLNGLLHGTASYDEFFSWLMQLPRNPNDN